MLKINTALSPLSRVLDPLVVKYTVESLSNTSLEDNRFEH
jgi:hypothetical protein